MANDGNIFAVHRHTADIPTKGDTYFQLHLGYKKNAFSINTRTIFISPILQGCWLIYEIYKHNSVFIYKI